MTILRLGSRGPEVKTWEETLVSLGYDVGGTVDDVFGPKVERATIRFQVDRKLAADGEVGDATRAAAGRVAPGPSAVAGMFDPTLRFIQASGYTRATYPRVVNLIPLHVMEARQGSNTAEAVGAWFAKPQSKSPGPPPPGFAPKASAHAGVDEDSVVQYVLPGDVAWGAPGGNSNGYHVEHAGYSAETDSDWASPANESMLRLSARHVAKACNFFGLPRARLSIDEVAVCTRDALIRKGQLHGTLSGSTGGICGHFALTSVWQNWRYYGLPNPKAGPSPWWPDHTDPGAHWPWDHYLELLKAS
jgi:peptidoglycan hydrolase-like protein with peptidoglycan-binding domain